MPTGADLTSLLGRGIEGRDRAVVDVQRVEHLALRVEGQPAAEMALAPDGSRRCRRPWGPSPLRVSFCAVEHEPVDDVRPAPGPPDPIEAGRGRQPEPALPDRLVIEDRLLLEVDQRELVGVVAAGGDQRVPAVGQGQDVQRQVLECHLLPRRRDDPAVGQDESLPAWPGIPWRFLGLEGRNQAQAGRREREESKTVEHRTSLESVKGRVPGPSPHPDSADAPCPMTISWRSSAQTPAIRRLYSRSAASSRSWAVVSPGRLCEGWI